jgi:proline racemase
MTRPASEVNISQVHPHQLRRPAAGGVKHLEDQPVPLSAKTLPRQGEKVLHFLFEEELGQTFGQLEVLSPPKRD